MERIEELKEVKEEIRRIIFLLDNSKHNQSWLTSRLLTLKREVEYIIKENEKDI